MIKILYHANCNDGFCAAWVLYTIYGESAQYIPVSYGQAPPVDLGIEDDIVIVDFSYPRPVLLDMRKNVKSLAVLDHHKTAQAELQGLDFCIFDMTKSGARIVWEQFKKEKEPHPLVLYTEDRDLWKWELPYSREINAALATYEHDFKLWDEYLSVKLSKHKEGLIECGKSILRYECKLIKQHVQHPVEYTILGHKVLGVNATVLFSDIAGELAVGKPFGFAYFIRDDGKVQYSLRSAPDGIDVSEIAKTFGGGGHKHAAGFESTALPYYLLS